jgi:nitrate/TMAO reductase-like tetraheme cytochrome c subunit
LKRLREVFDDRLTKAAGIILIVIIALIIFNIYSGFPEDHPLFGFIDYAMIPILFILGGVIFVLAIIRSGSKKGEEYVKQRRDKLIFLSFSGAISIILLVIGGYQLIEFTDSTAFCGELCHTVMKPEYNAHQASPHARVTCSECHVGSGASYLVRSKVTGIPLIFSTVFNRYDRPISAPVENLRPARETCEQCHWPDRFTGDIVRVHTTYAADEANTVSVDTRVFKVGGGEAEVAGDIHWHIGADVWYLPLDEKRQEIGWVGVEESDGQWREYIDSSRAVDITPDRIEDEKRLMDCMDCHNRATHIFNSPDDLIDNALTRGTIDKSIPFIKRESVNALDPPSTSISEAFSKVESIREFYITSYPSVYEKQSGSIDTAIAELKEIALLTTFPHMNVTWLTHPDSLGHQEWPGCFRCHGELIETSGERAGKVIEARCSLCHYNSE